MTIPVLQYPDLAEFQGLLKDADVLVYDTMGFEPGLVQFGDDAPVSHASLVLSNGEEVIDANQRPDGGPVVKTARLVDDVADISVRAVTALRHKEMTEDTAIQVIDYATNYYKKYSAKFDINGLAIVGIVAMYQSHREALEHYLTKDLLKDLVKQAVSKARKCIKPDHATLSCSEFVYRCLTESSAQLTIDIPVPLVTKNQGIVELGGDEQLAGMSELRQYFQDLSDNNEKNYPTPRPQAVQPGGALPDAVTPSDFWRSDSFSTIAVLQRVAMPTPRPPRPGGSIS